MDARATTPVLCGLPGCTQPCYDDGLVVHGYCGRTHARQATSGGFVAGARRSLTGITCKRPGCLQPPFFDSVTNRMHDFCSKRHAEEAMAHPGGGMGASKCKLKGCSKNVYRDPATSLESDYCSRGHQAHAIALGQGMRTVTPHVEQVFHGGTTGATDFKLSVLSKSHPQYSSLCHQFLVKWVKRGAPHVRRLFEVKVPADIYGKYAKYKQARGNVRRRFHGTSCSARCNLFVDLKGNPCDSRECNVCSICTNGFILQGNVGGTARRTSIGLRYGEGLYFSSVSGKSNDYAQGSETVSSDGKRQRCMFVANVTAGNAYLTQQVSLGQSMCPPAGHDSVVGEAGGGLNHDELVAYKNEAGIPSYLIVYALPCMRITRGDHFGYCRRPNMFISRASHKLVYLLFEFWCAPSNPNHYVELTCPGAELSLICAVEFLSIWR